MEVQPVLLLLLSITIILLNVLWQSYNCVLKSMSSVNLIFCSAAILMLVVW